MKKVAILGSTGSIGTQTLDVIDKNKDEFRITALVANSNGELLESQKKRFNAERTYLIERDGADCLFDAVDDCDTVVVATSGITALSCVISCLENGKTVALANKELLVAAGSLISAAGGKLYPVDSEHSAIWQCLDGREGVKKIILTASGGPFYGYTAQMLKKVTPEEALKHPNWKMGKKITIDSATMMNKAFEVIEAHWLFDLPADKISVAVHRQSIVHSLVVFDDGSVLAQMSRPDMRLPIQYALTYPERSTKFSPEFDLFSLSPLTFCPCDTETFPCVKLGHLALAKQPLYSAAMNAANDVAVEAFLRGDIPFDAIYKTVYDTCEKMALNGEITVQSVVYTDKTARQIAEKLVKIN